MKTEKKAANGGIFDEWGHANEARKAAKAKQIFVLARFAYDASRGKMRFSQARFAQ
jgi:hypothetical protein